MDTLSSSSSSSSSKRNSHQTQQQQHQVNKRRSNRPASDSTTPAPLPVAAVNNNTSTIPILNPDIYTRSFEEEQYTFGMWNVLFEADKVSDLYKHNRAAHMRNDVLMPRK